MILPQINLFLFLGIPIIIGIWIYNTPENIIELGVIFFEVFIILEEYFSKILSCTLEEEKIQTIYDYIIVGTGTAGSLIAANLSLMHLNKTVLVLEAGSHSSIFQNIPALAPLFHETHFNWKYKTKTQFNACGAMKNNQCNFPLGKGLGGSNLINNMIWHRGIESDYNGWFKNTNNYDYIKEIEPLFMNLEKKLQPEPLNYITKLGEILSKVNNTHGIRFVKPLLLQKFGKRFTTYDFAIQLLKPNIKYIENAIVKKINFNIDESVSVKGLTFEINKKKYKVLSKTIILSAGTIGSPKILLQSGIGPCNELEELNIKCIKNMPAVGKNLQDHIATGMSLFIYNESLNMNIVNLLQPKNIFKYLNPFNSVSRGPLSTVGCELLGFSNDNQIGYMFMPIDITSDNGIKLKNIMNINNNIWKNYFKEFINIQTISILPILLHPKSKGSIKLKKINNFDYDVIIDPQYLNDDTDIENLINGIKLIKDYVLEINKIENINLKLNEKKFPGCEKHIEENDYWKCYVKQMSFSIYHPVGTCKIDSTKINGVIDYHFKVHDINGLYIVDGSVMPNLPSGNPNAAIALLAERFLEINKIKY